VLGGERRSSRRRTDPSAGSTSITPAPASASSWPSGEKRRHLARDARRHRSWPVRVSTALTVPPQPPATTVVPSGEMPRPQTFAARRVSPVCSPPARSMRTVGDSLDLLLAELAAIAYCQPDGTFISTLEELRQWLVEMAQAGEAVCVDGLATRVQRPRGWANQKVLYDAKRHSHTAQGLAISTIHGDLLWLDGGWPGSCHEHELIQLAGLRALVEQSIAHLANAWSLRRWRGLLYRVRDVFRAAGALICLGRWLHRIPT